MKAKNNRLSRGAVRIIGGEHGGKKLQFVDKGGDLRPTSDRLRETLFNWLQFELPGRRVLDLFAGSGALAAEALSRGAAHATVVELKKPRCADLSRQLKPLFGDSVYIQCGDALQWLHQASGIWDLVFVDPPYDLHLQEKACRALEHGGLLADNALIYVESSHHEPAPEVPDNWHIDREKARGDVRAQLYKRQPPSTNEQK
jgi:16S rRNA (guanine966-N2)-methyltransferase